MKILFKISILVFVLIQLILNSQLLVVELMFVLLMLASNIFRTKYHNSKLLMGLEAAIIFISAEHNTIFLILYAITAFDLIELRLYIGIIPIIVIAYHYLELNTLLSFFLLIFLSCLFSYVNHSLKEKERGLKQSFDKERISRYQLEQSRAKLLASAKEITHLTEIKERNRIAREIHDNIGHSIAGILLQMQAAEKLFDKNHDKAQDLLKNSVSALSNTLVLLRETVHNIKPKDNLGIGYIESILKHFHYCPIDFKYIGDFSSISPNHMEILVSNIKEALTNISKHSKATRVEVLIETNEMYTRLVIKDNGVGCNSITENMGLGGMRDRINNIGGTISVNGNDGFMIVCMLYK
ncbi:sensor histidine kinase [Alkaliphilus serpentinus]|uniref:histidine kinase n=1 Tax=Alkaliphilus serpentinus TaxID=1482731 RepID=A0A833HP64_9FIRM|nr:sensor histidine kinase [Alkaliphilus serpentinus]KAB3530343.1 sensor histidine kinase [Alkaliphilus serpentinus]